MFLVYLIIDMVVGGVCIVSLMMYLNNNRNEQGELSVSTATRTFIKQATKFIKEST